MRITTRVAQLEHALGTKLGGCESCGGIDPRTRSGPFTGGLLLDQRDGTFWCMCKRCGFSFNARLVDREGRAVGPDDVPVNPVWFMAHDVRPDPGPV